MRVHCPAKLHQSGITLIELMIVVAVIAILSAVAYPSYTAYVARGNTAEAFAQLAQLRIQLEQFYQDNRSYGIAASTYQCGSSTNYIPISGTSATTACTSPGCAPSGTAYFTYTCTLHSDAVSDHYVLTATGISAKGMSGYTYTLDYAGNKQTTAFPGVSGTKNCWLQKSGDC